MYNVGNSEPVEVGDLVRLIEQELGIQATREMWPMQPGDVTETCADVSALERAIGFRPKTSLGEGVRSVRCLVPCLSRPLKAALGPSGENDA